MSKRTIFQKMVGRLATFGVFNSISDLKYLSIIYWARIGKKLDLANPHTFNEKLQWLKLYDRRPEYIRMVDKYSVKEYVASIIGKQYIIPTLGVWNSFDKIDFALLPEQFVLKCTHDSGGLVICKDKTQFDRVKARNKIEKCMRNNYYLHGREWPYKYVKPRIIAEKYMTDESGYELKDYKIFNFNGEAKVILVCSQRFSDNGLCEDFYDVNWKRLEVKRPKHAISEDIPKPVELEQMIRISEQLSKNVPFLRTDFYSVDGRLYFGELTFYPASGMEKFEPEEWDEILGEWIELPKI